MKGIVYVRVSSNEQVLGTSLASQEEMCLKYCAERSIEVLGVFREEGASAKTANRPVLVRALEFCRKHKPTVQAFVVAKVDRFARNTEDHFAVRGVLKRYGVSLHSVTEPIGNSPTEKLLETVLAGSAEFDNAIRTQRATDGMKSRLADGIWPWRPPIGYLCAGTKKQGIKKSSPDPIDPLRFPLIQRGLREYSAGQVQSLSQLAHLFNTWGLSSATGRPISVQTVDNILGRHLPFYAGILEDPFTGDELPGMHTPMISDEERRRIRLIRSGKFRHMKARDFDASQFALRRTALCSHCNRPFTASSPRGRTKRYPYYHCVTKECATYGKSFSQAKVEATFAKKLASVRLCFQTIVFVIESAAAFSKGRRQMERDRRRQLDDKILELRMQRDRIFELREDGSYSKEQFIERQRMNDDQLDELHGTLGELKKSSEHSFEIGPLIQDGLTFIRDLVVGWTVLPTRLKRRFQKVIFPTGISYDHVAGFGTAQLGPIFKLFDEFHDRFSRMVPLDGTGWNQFDREGVGWNLINEDLKELRAIYDEWKSGDVPQIITSLDPPDDSKLACMLGRID